MLKRTLIILLFCCGYSSLANANNYQDWWVTADKGMAFSVAQQNKTVLVFGFIRTEPETSISAFFSGELNAENKVSGKLDTTNTGQANAQGNTAEMTFTSINTATLDYVYNGTKGTISLERFAFSPLNAEGSWDGGSDAVVQCPGQQPFIDAREQKISVKTDAPSGTILNKHNINMHFVSGKGVCDDVGIISQDGSHINASGIGSCSVSIDGSAGHDQYTWEARDVIAEDFWFLAKFTQTITSGEHQGCVIKGILSGVRHSDTDITHEFDE